MDPTEAFPKAEPAPMRSLGVGGEHFAEVEEQLGRQLADLRLELPLTFPASHKGVELDKAMEATAAALCHGCP